MSDDWYIRKGHKTLGPLTEVEVRHVLDAGRISPDTPVRRGADGPWAPAGQALADGKGQRAPAPAKRPLRTPIAIGIVAALAVIVAIRWVAVRVGHRDVPPAIATAPAEEATKSTDAPPESAAEDSPAMEAPVVRDALVAVTPRQSLIAQRPASGRMAALATVAQKPKPRIVEVAPIVVPSAPATQADLAALEAAALRSSSANDALALYQLFGSTRAISPAVVELYQRNLQVWEARAGQGLVRLGEQWVAAADAAKAHQESAQLLQQAYEMTKVLDLKDARGTLEMASRVDPNSIAADFTAGIVSSISPARFRNPSLAAKHFEIVLRRSPGYVPALNNLALVEIREEKYAEAVRYLREAADHSPAPEEVTQNLGRFISEAQLGRIHPTQPVLSEATELYSRVATPAERTAAADRPKHGWRYMPLVLPKEEREGLTRLEAPETESTAVVRGTGLVVATRYVLTCRHLVDDLTLGRADKIELVDPTDFRRERRLAASLVAVDEADDLCLLRCDGLKAPPCALAQALPPRGSEVFLTDFPAGSAFAAGLKTTPGIVTALPGQVARLAGPKWLDFSRQLWCDAGAGHRADGGALSDNHGNVVAIPSAFYASGDGAASSRYVGGVPGPIARAFVRSSLPSFGDAPVGGPSLTWSDVEAKVGPSLVSVAIGYRKVVIALSGKADASRLKQADTYDDRFCTACNGRARIRCPAPGCPFVGLRDEYSANDPVVASPTKASARTTCPACLGSGRVRCPHCSTGVDPLLR